MTLSAQRSATSFSPSELGAPVSPGGRGRIVLAIRPVERAVEHVVGREMQEGNAEPRRGFGHMARPFAVDLSASRLLRLGLVDRGIGGGVDHDVRARRLEPGEDGGAVGEVERRPAERDDLGLVARALDAARSPPGPSIR